MIHCGELSGLYYLISRFSDKSVSFSRVTDHLSKKSKKEEGMKDAQLERPGNAEMRECCLCMQYSKKKKKKRKKLFTKFFCA